MGKNKGNNEEMTFKQGFSDALIPEEEKTYDIPDEWVYVTLKNISNMKYGKNLPTSKLNDNGEYPVFGANGVIGFYNNFIYKDEQVLISCRGANSGYINLSPKKAYITNNSIIVEINENFITKKFLFYCLKNLNKQKIITGTAQPQVTITNANNLILFLPPLAEQKRIVDKLDSMLGKIRQAKELIDEARETFKLRRQAILAKAFRGELTKDWREENPDVESAEELVEKIKNKNQDLINNDNLYILPNKWCWTNLGTIIEKPIYGTSKKCDFNYNGIGVLRIPNIINGIIDISNLKFAEFNEKEINTYKLQEGDILTIRSNGSVDLVGKCALIQNKDVKFLFAGYLIRLRPKFNILDSKYLLYCTETNHIRLQIETKAKSTSGVNNINSAELQSLILPLAPLEEQIEIVKRIERLLELEDNAKELLDMDEHLDLLEKSILAKAFRGELGTGNPDDEPAITLLERILREREE